MATRVSQLGSELDNFGYAEVLAETPPTLFPSLSTLTRVLEGTHPLDIAVGDGLDRLVARRLIVAQRDQRVPERGAADGEPDESGHLCRRAQPGNDAGFVELS